MDGVRGPVPAAPGAVQQRAGFQARAGRQANARATAPAGRQEEAAAARSSQAADGPRLERASPGAGLTMPAVRGEAGGRMYRERTFSVAAKLDPGCDRCWSATWWLTR